MKSSQLEVRKPIKAATTVGSALRAAKEGACHATQRGEHGPREGLRLYNVTGPQGTTTTKFQHSPRTSGPTAVRQLSCARGHVRRLSSTKDLASATTLSPSPCSLHTAVNGDIKFGLVFVNCPCLPVRTLPLTGTIPDPFWEKGLGEDKEGYYRSQHQLQCCMQSGSASCVLLLESQLPAARRCMPASSWACEILTLRIHLLEDPSNLTI